MPTPCDEAQIALVNGVEDEALRAHVDRCEECRFFKSLSRSLARGLALPTPAAASGVGPAIEAALAESAASGEPLLGRYLLEARLGSGGQGSVYRARNLDTGETVALKFVRLRGAPLEVVHAHLVQHPNVCRVYHTEPHGALRLIEMEYIDGQALGEYAAASSQADKRRVFRGVCEGVAAAHDAGVLHLDLKPSNVLVRPGGEPVVTDFGLSASLGQEGGVARGGTPGYMAPEQLGSGAVDRRADIYALGVLLRELFPRPPRSLARVVLRATAAGPALRHPDVRHLLRDFDRPVRLRRTALYLAAVTAPLTLVVLGLVRSGPTVRLRGDVLVLGGRGPDQSWAASAEVYEAGTGRWRSVDPVPDPGWSAPRMCGARAVRTGDEVLVLGGGSSSGCADDGATTRRVRVLSIASSTWSVPRCQEPCVEFEGTTYAFDAAARDFKQRWKKAACQTNGACMEFGRNYFVALRLGSEDVFVLGGCAGACAGPNELSQTLLRPAPLARTAEIYRRSRKEWEALPPSLHPRAGARAVDMGGGILVCGGGSGFTPGPGEPNPRAHPHTCEFFDVNSSFNGAPPWRPAGTMPSAKLPVMVSVSSLVGDAAVVGVQPGHAWLWRFQGEWAWDFSAWTWDTSFFETLPTPEDGQEGGTLTLLSDGRILFAGGREAGQATAGAQLLTLPPGGRGGVWRRAPPMRHARFDHVAVPLADGRVLVAGGCSPDPIAAAEIYDPVHNEWSDAGTLSTPRCQAQAVPLW